MNQTMKYFATSAAVVALTFVGSLSAEETKGTVKSVNTEKHEVVLKGAIRNTIYELRKDAYVGLDGMKSNLAALREGDTVVINYDKQGEHFMANEVRGLRDAKEASGTVRSVFNDKHEITLKGVVSDTTYELKKDGSVWINNNTSKLSDVREGDQVLVTYQQKGDHYMASNVRITRKQN